MQKPPHKPIAEADRLAALHRLKILDTEFEPDFDAIAKLAADICDTPLALISFVDADRQWFKAAHGLDARETSREVSFCAHAMLWPELFIVPDAHQDPRFADNALVTGEPRVCFYAGAPLIDSSNIGLGSLCVIDHVPRELNDRQKYQLRLLADLVIQISENRARSLALQEKILEKERIAEQHYNEAPALLSSIDAQGNIVNVSQRWCEEMGYAKADVIGTSILQYLTPASRAFIEAALSTPPTQRTQGYDIPQQVLKHDGSTMDILLSFTTEHAPDGQFLRSHGAWVDVTQENIQKQHIAALIDKLSVAVKSVNLGVWEYDVSADKLTFDDVQCALYELDPNAPLTYEMWRQKLWPEDLITTELALARAFAAGETFKGHFRITLKGGTTRWIRSAVTQLCDAAGQPYKMVGVNWDATTETLHTLNIARLEQRFRQVIESAPNALIVSNDEGIIELVNAQTEQYFGYHRDELLGQSVDILLPTRHHAGHHIQRKSYIEAPSTRAMGSRDALPAKRRDGSEFQVEVGLSPIQTEDGTKILASVVDISTRMALNNRLTLATQALGLGIWELNLITHALHWDAPLYKMYDIDPNVGDKTYAMWRAQVHPDDIDATEQGLQAAIEGRTGFKGTFRIITKSGAIRWISSHSVLNLSPEGMPLSMTGVNWDITELKHTELQLQKNADFMARTGKLAKVGGWELDFADNKLIWTEETFHIHDLEPGTQPTLEEATHFYAPEAQPVIRQAIQTSTEAGTGWDLELPFITATGRPIWVRAIGTPIFDADGTTIGLNGAFQDITERKNAQAQVEMVQTQLQSVLDSASSLGLISTDLNGTIKLFSKGAENMLGYTAAEMVDKTTPAVFHKIEEIIQRGQTLSAQYGQEIAGFDVFTAAAQRGEIDSREWTYIHKDNREIPVNLTVTGIRDANHTLVAYLGVAKDISEDKKIRQTLDESLQRAEAASLAKSQFLANMSHEIRTPMNAILGMQQLLQLTELSTRQFDYVDKTQTAAESLLRLIDDILDFSKIEANKITLENLPFSLNKIMRDLSTLLSTSIGKKHIEVLFSIDPATPNWVMGDALRLRQVLLNLASNAIKFTTLGEVIITLSVVATSTQVSELRFSVRDTGIGIPPDKLGLIFEGFNQAEASTTRRFGGTGLGLAISQRLTALMGGQLSVNSILGAGSEFSFCLAFELAPIEYPIPPAPVLPQGMRVLIVDDNASARMVLQSMVESLGWQATTLMSGDDALTLLKLPPPPAFDIIFMDWNMPGLDGWETTRQIRQLQQIDTMPIVIMVTAHGREAVAERMKAEQNILNGFLEKPITASMLFDAVIDATASQNQGANGTVARPTQQRLAGLRLLVVEDNPLNQQVARELLQNEGAWVEVAEGGTQGVARASEVNQPLDAILMDIQMPDMDGYTATQILRSRAKTLHVPIIAMTANAMESDRQACLDCGMNDHIGKPIHIDHVVATLLKYCPIAPAATAHKPSAPAEKPPAPTLDIELALQRLGGNRALLANLIHRFIADTAGTVSTLQEQLLLGDTQQAVATLHTLKGMASTLGANTLAAFAAEKENTLKAGVSNNTGLNVAATCEALSKLLRESQSQLSEIVKTLVPPPPPDTRSKTWNPIRSAGFHSMLFELEMLLQNANMQAVTLFNDLMEQFGGTLQAELKPLSEAMYQLDFKQALLHCQTLSRSIE